MAGLARLVVLGELRRHERTGRPLGGEAFLKRLERRLGRFLHRKPPGWNPKKEKNKCGVLINADRRERSYVYYTHSRKGKWKRWDDHELLYRPITLEI